MKILILGGIKEAAELAENLVCEGHDVTTSLAGRTKEPKPVAGKIRIGGFGGAEGLANYLTENAIDLLIDCTHPFAKQISANASEAAEIANVKFDIRKREPWQQQKGDHWIEVSSLEEMRETLPSGSRVLLALGSQYIDLFKSRGDVHFLVRMVDEPTKQLALPNHQLLLGRPSTNWRDEAKLLKKHSITHIACRNSGGYGAYAKIEAARKLELPVIILRR